MTKTKYYHFNGFNAQTGEFDPNKYVIVDEQSGRYIDVGKGEGPDIENAINMAGKYIMPGLINAHIHIDSDVNHEFGKEKFGVDSDEEHVRAGVIEAHKKGIKVAVHAQGAEGIKIAVRAGVDSVEHSFHSDDESIELMKNKGTSVVPTMIAMKRIIDRPDEVPSWMIERTITHWEAHQKSIEKAAAAGVNIVMGTDSGTPFNGFGNESAVEMDMMVAFGHMTPQQVLKSATVNAAKMMGINDHYGAIAVGRYADFIVIRENPINNMKVLQQEQKQIFQHGHAVIR